MTDNKKRRFPELDKVVPQNIGDDKQEERYSIAWYFVDNESGEEIPWDDAEEISPLIPESLLDGAERLKALESEAERLGGHLGRHHTDAEYDELKAKLNWYKSLLMGSKDDVVEACGLEVGRLHTELIETKAKLSQMSALIEDRDELAKEVRELKLAELYWYQGWLKVTAEVERLKEAQK